MKNIIKSSARKNMLLSFFVIILSMPNYNLNANAIEAYNKNFSSDDNLIENIMKSKGDIFGKVLKDPDKYEVQILYTQINRDKNNVPSFKSFKYRVDKNKYFYPASAVKLSACALALEKLNNLNLDKDTSLKIEKERASQKSVDFDCSSQNNLPSIANYIKKVLVASDNDGFDRLYEFLGQKYYNETLWNKGYKDVVILHRLGQNLSYEENKYTNPIKFYKGEEVVYSQSGKYNNSSYLNRVGCKKGKGYIEGGILVREPKDFSKSNYFSVECLQGILKAIIFPESVPKMQRFNLNKEDYEFLKKYMSIVPRKCDNPKYDYKDSQFKYFIFGDSSKRIPQNIKVYNKIGCAYGYLVDNAYITDSKNNIEFMLTAVIYCNENGIFNDGQYEYSTVGMPFLANIGRAIYDYESNGRKL